MAPDPDLSHKESSPAQVGLPECLYKPLLHAFFVTASASRLSLLCLLPPPQSGPHDPFKRHALPMPGACSFRLQPTGARLCVSQVASA